ncbi:MAG: HAMP domain-containing protein, partial [Actinobacteria bacterium]|nr:HAMP domain-containing protein [Actinomycetota bacterium]
MSRVSSIRSAAQATFSAPRQIPIRWRLAGGSALLTLVILCGFAGAVGGLTSQRLHDDFEREVSDAADLLQARIKYDALVPGTEPNSYELDGLSPPLAYYDDGQTIVRIVLRDGVLLDSTSLTTDFGPPEVKTSKQDGYLVETREIPRVGDEVVYIPLYLQYARPLASVDATVGRLRLFLIIGVLSGAGLALLAGLMVARRAMAPIASLTATARKIERTRDPAEKIPAVEADDEVAELARTLDGMLHALDSSRAETEDALRRQREFVADASHELRTPLTSVLANLELLAESLDGEQQEAAHSALRSSRRMRRLVADLLLLARHDAARQAPHTPTDVGQVLIEAAGELGVIAVAMDYRGTEIIPREGDVPTSRGWRVAEGAEDTIAAAQLFEASCPGLGTISNFGVSMGGNTSGLVAAEGATRADGLTPLFDYWIAVEGVHNVIETYQEARVASLAVEFARTTVEDIEAEMGGPFESHSPVFAERTNVNRVDDIAGSGVRGVLLVHAYEDGTVPYNQSGEMARRLR